MSPWLFNVYMDGVVREVNIRGLEKGLELLTANGGRFEINLQLFADDTTLSGRTEWPLSVIPCALVWHSEVARSRLTQCIKSCDLQPALQCAIPGAQGVLPCVGWGVRPVNWIYHL